jgi:hypothetical protein
LAGRPEGLFRRFRNRFKRFIDCVPLDLALALCNWAARESVTEKHEAKAAVVEQKKRSLKSGQVRTSFGGRTISLSERVLVIGTPAARPRCLKPQLGK